jgi:hypothetical protein
LKGILAKDQEKKEGRVMTKQKLGMVLFWIAVIWAIGWGVVGSVFVGSAFRTLTMDELNQTMWAPEGTWMMIWGLFGVPLAAIVAIIGILLYSEAKGMTILKFVLGIVLVGVVIATANTLEYNPLLFGIGGTLILLFFIGILWLWAKERMAMKETSTTASDLKLAGYMFMLIAAWFICGIASQPFMKALKGETPSSPMHVLIFLVLGWLFLFLGHYKSRQQ